LQGILEAADSFGLAFMLTVYPKTETVQRKNEKTTKELYKGIGL